MVSISIQIPILNTKYDKHSRYNSYISQRLKCEQGLSVVTIHQHNGMGTKFQAIAELQNPAVKERHWIQLIEATKRKTSLGDNFTVSLITDSETTLADLLALDLHRYEDEVRSIVDRAVREVSMEKTLRELESTWASLELSREVHARTGLTLLKASDELIAILEDNQVSILQSKSIPIQANSLAVIGIQLA